MTESTTALTPVADPSPIVKIIGVFTSPSKTFEAIARKPGWDWLVPMALLMLAIFVYSVIVTPRIDDAAFIQQVMKKIEANPNIPEQARDNARARMEKQFAFSKKPIGRAIGSVIFAALIFVVPAVWFAVAAMFGVRKTYLGIVACYAYVQLVQVIWWVLAAIVAIPKEGIDVFDAQLFRILKSSPGDFMSLEGNNRFLVMVASYIDPFEIVAIILGGIALSKATSFTRKGATIAVFSVWVVWVLLVACQQQLSAMFGA
jgi:Yip1-like protein